MKKLIVLSSFFIALTFALQAQTGKIAGKIVDGKTGETLPGATVVIDGTTKGGSADFDGNFSINNVPAGTYNLVVSFITYDTKKLTGIKVPAGDVVTLNITLEQSNGQNLEGVTVQAEMNKENTNTLLVMQKNNASMSDGVSAETIKKTPDRNTSDVLKRVSGASIQDNKFAIIRGLNDRYNAAYINGAPLPSSESDRKAFSFDIFPAALLDNLVINKTATPDMPAEFAGGIIQINTKSIPEKNFQSLSIGGGYNTVTTFKDRLSYEGGKWDWLGIDDGSRKMSSAIPDVKHFPVNTNSQAALARQVSANDWGTNGNKNFAPNMSFQYSMGQTFLRKEKDFLGMILSLTYNRNYSLIETQRRTYQSNPNPDEPSQMETDYNDKSYSTQTLVGALANFSLKLNENNTLSFKNMFSINSDDRTIRRTGTPTPVDPNPILIKSTALWFTSNKIYTGQLGGEHFIPKTKMKVTWLGGYSNIRRDIPDLRRSIYTRYKNITDPTSPNASDTMYVANVSNSNVGPDYSGGMFYSTNNESIYSVKGDISYPFNFGEKWKNEVKVGGSFQDRQRDFFARQLGYTRYGAPGSSITFDNNLLYLPDDQIFASQNMGLLSPGVGGFKLQDATKPGDSYTASSRLMATYVMFDNRFKDKVRLIWGARLENFNQKLFAMRTTKDTVDLNTTKLDILPSANLVYSLTEKQNIRFAYSQTVNRPEFRELAPFAFYDFNTQYVYSGNDTLKRSLIHNYDLRYEFYPGRGQLLSVTGFYKDFVNPIEQITRPDVSGELSFRNVPKAKSYGMEVEFRLVIGALFKADSSKFNKFLNDLTVYSNLALIKSEVDVSKVIGAVSNTRPLQGQSPYVFNAGIMYNNSENGLSFSAAINRVGPRIAIVGTVADPDIWENGRTVLDLQIGKSFLKNQLDVKLNLRDALAQKLYFFQDRNNNQKFDKGVDDEIWTTKFGQTISLTVGYKF